MFVSIKTQLAVAICVLFVMLFLVQSIPTISYLEQTSRDTLAKEQFQRTCSEAEQIDTKLQQAHHTLIAVAAVFPLELFADVQAAQAWLNDRRGIASTFDNGLFLFTATGKLFVENPQLPNRRGRDYSFRPYFQQTIQRNQPFISDPYRSSKTHMPAIMMTAPIYNKQQQIIGVLGGSLDLLKKNFFASLSTETVGADGYFCLFSLDRTIIIHHDKSLMLASTAPVGENPVLDRAMNGFEGTDKTIDAAGVAMLTSYKKISIKPWVLSGNRPLVEVYAVTRHLKNILWLLMGCSTLIILLTMLFLFNYTISPLVKFTRHIQHIDEYDDEQRMFNYQGKNEIGVLIKTFNQMLKQSDVTKKILNELATRDSLTNLYNRRMFLEFAEKMIHQAKRNDRGLCLIMLDLDHFKQINDAHGHLAGDEVLTAVAKILDQKMRVASVCGRYGGEEFCLLLPDTNLAGAEIIAERLRSSIEGADIVLPYPEGDKECDEIIHITASFGIVQWQEGWSIDTLINKADQALYRAKESGRNRVITD